MSSKAKDRLITYSYQKRKGGTGKSNDNGTDVKDVKPGTSKSPFEKDMQILKDFDLNWEYGPSMGVTRLERWNRAEKHGLNPSKVVRQLIQDHSDNEQYTQCLWNDYKNIM